MKRDCPNIQCSNKTPIRNVIKRGFFKRTSDSKTIQRFHCLSCKKNFSAATFSENYYQKKRRLNPIIYRMLCSGSSQRRIARLLNINLKTVARKFIFLSKKMEQENLEYALSMRNVSKIQFDEMETWDHSKLKPVSIINIVEKDTRKILAAHACDMPAKGLIKDKSIKKYGKRKDQRPSMFIDVFTKLKDTFPDIDEIESDQNPRYKRYVDKYYPKSSYIQYKGRRGCVVGQGELKAGGFDPLFSLNHTCAMFRANINRLFRRSWCTSKNVESLNRHIQLYIHYHNHYLTA